MHCGGSSIITTVITTVHLTQTSGNDCNEITRTWFNTNVGVSTVLIQREYPVICTELCTELYRVYKSGILVHRTYWDIIVCHDAIDNMLF